MRSLLSTRNGHPELQIDGLRPSPGFGRLQQPNYWAREKLDQFFAPDFDLFFVQIGELDTLGWCWDGRGGYDYRQYELHIDSILRKKPNARLILFIGGRPPYAWQQAHSDELVLKPGGQLTNMASPSSPRWVADSSEAVRRFVAHFEASPWADRIAGYNPLVFTNEWLLGEFHTDLQPAAIERYRAWLKNHYQGDLAALRRAWKRDDVDFATAPIPGPADIDAHGLGGLFDRVEKFGHLASDYLRYFNESVARLVCAHATAVKEASQRRKIVSVMFGYTYSYLSGHKSMAHSSHLDAIRAFDHPDIDLFHAPYDYYNRCAGGVHYSQLSADSILARGKLFASQIDTKTHVHDMDRGNAETPWESEQVLTRDVAFALTRNAYHYYYEMCVPCWRGQTGTVEYRDLGFIPDNIQRIMVQLRRAADANHAEMPASATQVAFITSREAPYHRALEKSYHNLFMQGLRNYFLCYAAAPFHDLLLEDWELFRQDYKVYIFTDAHFIPAARRRAIREKLQRLGATAVWFYAPGYVDETGASLDHIAELTGHRLHIRADIRDFLQIELPPAADPAAAHPLLQGLPDAIRSFGSDIPYSFFQDKQEWLPWQLKERDEYKLSPLFTVAPDAATTVLGTLRGAREPGFAVKNHGGMQSIFLGAPLPPPEIWMNIFRSAGVHLYSDGPDLIYANARYVCLCANGAGRKVLRLPRRCDLYNALTDTLLASAVDHYAYDAQEKQVDLFRLGD